MASLGDYERLKEVPAGPTKRAHGSSGPRGLQQRSSGVTPLRIVGAGAGRHHGPENTATWPRSYDVIEGDVQQGSGKQRIMFTIRMSEGPVWTAMTRSPNRQCHFQRQRAPWSRLSTARFSAWGLPGRRG
jgi:hypothetical protein